MAYFSDSLCWQRNYFLVIKAIQLVFLLCKADLNKESMSFMDPWWGILQMTWFNRKKIKIRKDGFDNSEIDHQETIGSRAREEVKPLPLFKLSLVREPL